MNCSQWPALGTPTQSLSLTAVDAFASRGSVQHLGPLSTADWPHIWDTWSITYKSFPRKLNYVSYIPWSWPMHWSDRKWAWPQESLTTAASLAVCLPQMQKSWWKQAHICQGLLTPYIQLLAAFPKTRSTIVSNFPSNLFFPASNFS